MNAWNQFKCLNFEQTATVDIYFYIEYLPQLILTNECGVGQENIIVIVFTIV